MLVLQNAATDLIRAVTGSAADIEVVVDYVEYDTSVPPVVQAVVGTVNASITTATTTSLLIGATSRKRVVKSIHLFNRSATSSTVLVERFDNTNNNGLAFANLLQNEALVYTEAGVWLHYDANGAIYPSVGNAATQAEMEAGTATDKYVTPQGVNWHPGVNKFWVKADVAGAVQASWNVTGLVDNGTGDITVTIATDFSSANWCASVAVEMTATTYAVANSREPHVRFGGQAAGTVRCDCIDNTVTTNAIKDPTMWHIAGLGDQ